MITVHEIESRRELREFVEFPNRLYKDNKYYVPQIVSMEMDTLDPKKNHAFEVCDCSCFVARNERGEVVGRIAAIINKAYNNKVGEKICRFGWMDFIDDMEVSSALVERVKQYARDHGMTRLSGPEGFLEFDALGIVIEGYDEYPTAYGKYNFPYYVQHMEKLGFEKQIDYVEFLIDVPEDIPEKYGRAAKIVAERYGLHEAPIHRHSDINKYADRVFACMNEGYAQLHGYSQLSPGQLEDLKKQFLSNINIDYLSVILNEKDECVGFGVCMPALNKALQKARGHMFPFGWVHILRALTHNDTVDALLVAVTLEYRSKGVHAMIFDKIARGLKKNGIRYIESTRELEDNNRVQNIWGPFQRRLHKRARTYTMNV